jgi:hypothetical protein
MGGFAGAVTSSKYVTRFKQNTLLITLQLQALALGAKAVGIGRPVLYGMAGYGQEGVERVLELLKGKMIIGFGHCCC